MCLHEQGSNSSDASTHSTNLRCWGTRIEWLNLERSPDCCRLACCGFFPLPGFNPPCGLVVTRQPVQSRGSARQLLQSKRWDLISGPTCSHAAQVAPNSIKRSSTGLCGAALACHSQFEPHSPSVSAQVALTTQLGKYGQAKRTDNAVVSAFHLTKKPGGFQRQPTLTIHGLYTGKAGFRRANRWKPARSFCPVIASVQIAEVFPIGP